MTSTSSSSNQNGGGGVPKGVGIGTVFNVAESENQTQPFAGLTLLSQVFFESGCDVRPMHPANLLHPSMRVGLRDPINEERRKIDRILSHDVATSHRYSCQTIYKYYCEQYKVRCNSQLFNSLPSKGGEFHTTTELSVAGNYIGDRGVLPLLEVGRLSPNLRSLNFSGNGIKNSGCEWIVDFVLSTPKLCPKLSSVDLSGNKLTLGGGKVLLLMAQQRPSITEVILKTAAQTVTKTGDQRKRSSSTTAVAAVADTSSSSKEEAEAVAAAADRGMRIDASTMRRLEEQLAQNRKRAEAVTGIRRM